MLIAFDSNKKRIDINDAIKDEQYFCPICGSKLTQKHGQKRIPHFAHWKGSACSDNWQYEAMTEWHRSWQERYPFQDREVVIKKDGVQHRADVQINGTIIEFQHSPMSISQFNARNNFYTSLGNKLIWLFDGSSGNEKTSTNYNVHTYIQKQDEITDIDEIEHYTKNEFVTLSSNGTLGKPKLYHTLYIKKRTNGEMEYWGCPINDDKFAPQKSDHNRTSCDGCKHCLYYDFFFVRCMGRFKDYDINTVINWDNNTLSYVDHDGTINEVFIKPPETEGKPIKDIAYEMNPKEMVVRNINSGYAFKVIDPVDCFERCSKVYGFGEKVHKQFYSKSVEILHANEPSWVVEEIKKG